MQPSYSFPPLYMPRHPHDASLKWQKKRNGSRENPHTNLMLFPREVIQEGLPDQRRWPLDTLLAGHSDPITSLEDKIHKQLASLRRCR